ncbi:MAG TPA: nickel-responsive transcriptional regulator NikR [Spirochaetota bacterium]|nr:nickel-responsive transcriptional regulator NikR [Spirochaetota bacterium]HPI89891.1 nickel-responsive transcriptional regulator NikR [Spirochaetota bacterium]HPR47824.1 nickel-responsive transcriptional regulator NikR [Spirochaetota bacterium]
MNNIVRFGVSIDEKLLDKFDTLISQKGYVNRSEAIRDLIRSMIVNEDISDPEAESIGTLSLVYNHHTSELADKLNDLQHSHYKNIVSTTHVHLDEHNCLEVLILKGKSKDVKMIADKLSSIKNVKNGQLTLTKAEKDHE